MSKTKIVQHWRYPDEEALPGGSHVARLNFKTSRVSVYKCLLLIVSFAVTVAIWPREVVSCRDFILQAVTTFWAMSLVGVYPGRASMRSSLSQIVYWPPATSRVLSLGCFNNGALLAWLNSIPPTQRGNPPPPPHTHAHTRREEEREPWGRGW